MLLVLAFAVAAIGMRPDGVRDWMDGTAWLSRRRFLRRNAKADFEAGWRDLHAAHCSVR
jgi:hypothetical protein